MQPTHKREDNWGRLLTRVGRQRDCGAFAMLYDHFAPLIKGFCLSNPRFSNSAAEELLQEVMLQIWRKAPYFEASRVSASTWIYTVTRNCRIARNCDGHFGGVEVDDIWDDTVENQPFIFLQRSRSSDDINQRLQNLPVEQFHVIKKIYTEGQSHGKLSTDLELSVPAVKSRLRLALKKLQINAVR